MIVSPQGSDSKIAERNRGFSGYGDVAESERYARIGWPLQAIVSVVGPAQSKGGSVQPKGVPVARHATRTSSSPG